MFVECRSQESDLEALMTDLVAVEKNREADKASHEAALDGLRSEMGTIQVPCSLMAVHQRHLCEGRVLRHYNTVTRFTC